MATAAFGEPIQLSSAAPAEGMGTAGASAGAAGAGATPSDAEQNLLDPNDPRLVSEELNVNPEADAYAQPAPPPDGDYRVKLKLIRPKDSKGQEMDYLPKLWGKAPGQAVFVTGIEASIIDPRHPEYDGLKAFDFNMSTFVGRDSSTKVSTLLGKLRRPDGKPWTDKHTRGNAKVWMDMLVRALAGEPEVGATTVWEWSCADCGKEAKAKGSAYPKAVLGMHKFPAEQDQKKRAAGQLYSAEMKCPIAPAHGYSRARISIARFLSLEELKK
jgi:hypothetical protein